MAVHSKTHQYLFIMAPRTACTATGVLLCQQVDGNWMPRRNVLDDNGHVVVDRKHGTLDDLITHGILEPARAEKLFKFTTVRNPFDSLVSLYVKKRTSYRPLLDDEDSFVNRKPGFAEDMQFVMEHSFSEWVQRQYALRPFARRTRHLYARYIKGMDYIMKFENLQADFNQAMEMIGVDRRIEIPLLNPTEERDPDYRSYYDRRARKTVERAFRDDLTRFGYEF